MINNKKNSTRAWLLAAGIAASYAILGECEAMSRSLLPDASVAKQFPGKQFFDEERAEQGINAQEKGQALAIIDIMQRNVTQNTEKDFPLNNLKNGFFRAIESILNAKISHNEDVNMKTNNDIAGQINKVRENASWFAEGNDGTSYSGVLANFLGYSNDMTLRWYIYLFLRCAIESKYYDNALTYTNCLYRAKYLVFRICEVWYALYVNATSDAFHKDIEEGKIVPLSSREINTDIATLKIMRERAQKGQTVIPNGDFAPYLASNMLNVMTQKDVGQAYIDLINELKSLKTTAKYRGLNVPVGLASVIAQAFGVKVDESSDLPIKISTYLAITESDGTPQKEISKRQKIIDEICDIWRKSEKASLSPAAVNASKSDGNLQLIQSIRANCDGETADAFLKFFESILDDVSGRNVTGFGKLFTGVSQKDRETIIAALQNLIMVSGNVSLDEFMDIALPYITTVCAVFRKTSEEATADSRRAPLTPVNTSGGTSTTAQKEVKKHKNYLTPEERKARPSVPSSNDDDDNDEQITANTNNDTAGILPEQSGKQSDSKPKKKKLSSKKFRPRTSKTNDE